MFLGETTGPDARGEIFKRFRLTYTRKGVAHNRLDKVYCAQGNLAIDFDPVTEVFPKLRLEDSFSTLNFQDQVLCGVFPKLKAPPHALRLAPKMRGVVAHSSEIA